MHTTSQALRGDAARPDAAAPSAGGVTVQHQLEHSLETIGVTNSHRKVLALILLGVLFDVLEQNAVGLVGPLLQEYWGISTRDVGFLNTLTFAAAALGRLLSGYIADHYGRRVMLTINLGLFTLGALICALAPSYWVLGLGRVIVGFGLGGEISIAVTMLAEFCSSRFRGTAVGTINVAGGGLGNMLAPAFGLLVFTLFPGPESWRWLFGLLVMPAFMVLFYRRYIPETPRFLVSQGRIEEANKVLNILASGKLGRNVANPYPYLQSGPQARKAERVRLGEIFQGSLALRTLVTGIAVCMTYGAQLTVLTLMPTLLVEQGHSLVKSYTFTILMQSGSLLGALTASYLGSRMPRKRVFTVGALMACASGLAFGFLSHNIALVLLFGAAFQFCVLLLNTTIWIFAPELYPTRVRAFGTAFILALGTLAGAFVPTLSGWVLEVYGVGGMFTLMAGMYVTFAAVLQLAPETFGRPLDT
ncbi:MFS transporter [Alcaligenes sp. WGS1538]|uniref:MFS transporter n=1 Tax=Alcaligenes sp. WGS1538 TaxID=3366811 RepID=UPI00372D6DB9